MFVFRFGYLMRVGILLSTNRKIVCPTRKWSNLKFGRQSAALCSACEYVNSQIGKKINKDFSKQITVKSISCDFLKYTYNMSKTRRKGKRSDLWLGKRAKKAY